MTENGSDLVLDGNAAAGLLQEIFVLEITKAQIQCNACGSTAAVPSGKWLEFAGGVISGLFNQPEPALSRRRRSRHDDG
jgi:Family of unknown function (DUF6510)